jgi:TPP-dependent pyruvate/acetoin dehydrogenase alpha subunit
MASSSGKSASKAKGSTKNGSTARAAAPPAAVASDASLFDIGGIDAPTLLDWYATMQLGRRLDEKAANYLKMAKGWSYHAPFAGHDGIQLALGKVFRAKKDSPTIGTC